MTIQLFGNLITLITHTLGNLMTLITNTHLDIFNDLIIHKFPQVYPMKVDMNTSKLSLYL